MSSPSSKPIRGGRNRRGNASRTRGTNSRPPTDPDAFTGEDWDAFFKRTGALRAWRDDDSLARLLAFCPAPGTSGHMHQNIQTLLEEDLGHTEASTDVTNLSSAIDKGLHLSGGGGLPGAQGNVTGSTTRHVSDSTAARSAKRQQNESYTGHYIGMTLWLHKEHLVLTRDCKRFFADGWSGYAGEGMGAVLEAFQSTFGTTFYREVDVGVSRQKLAASRQDDATRSQEEHNSRAISANLRGEGPNASLGVGGHHKNDGGYSASGTTASGKTGGSHYSHGGASSLAHTDDQTWRESLKDPESWVVIRDRRRDAVPTLHLVRDVAKIAVTQNDPEAATIVQRSSDLLQHLQGLEQKLEQKLEQRLKEMEIRRACSRDIKLKFEIRDKTLMVTAFAVEGLRELQVFNEHWRKTGKTGMIKSDKSIAPELGDDLDFCYGEWAVRTFPYVITIQCHTVDGWYAKGVREDYREPAFDQAYSSQPMLTHTSESGSPEQRHLYIYSFCVVTARLVSNKGDAQFTIPVHNRERYKRLMIEQGLGTLDDAPGPKLCLPAG